MADREAMNLPPMPEPAYGLQRQDENGRWREAATGERAFSAAQLQEQRAACYAAGMEAAAKVCTGVADELWRRRARTPRDALTVGRMEGADQCVAAIRAAMPQKP